MNEIKTLLDRQGPIMPPTLPAELRDLYGGDLSFPATAEPYVIANFATTLDGVVSYQIPGESTGGEISGHNTEDHFIMALLRASADAVMVGSETFCQVSPSHLWNAEGIYPQAARLFQAYRSKRAEHPLVVIVSGSGRVDVSRAVFHARGVKTLIVTTSEGKQRIDAACANTECAVQTRVVDSAPRIAPERIVSMLRGEFNVRLLLHEGGPMLLGEFVAANLVDELFLTLAPQVAGRDSKADRLALVRDVAFSPDTAPWLKLVSVKQGGDHLYLRYRRTTGD